MIAYPFHDASGRISVAVGIPGTCHRTAPLLEAAGIGQHQPASRHQADEVATALRRDEAHVREVAEEPVDMYVHGRVQVHGINEPVVLEAPRQSADGLADLLDASPKFSRLPTPGPNHHDGSG